jgi:hypothetical protein
VRNPKVVKLLILAKPTTYQKALEIVPLGMERRHCSDLRMAKERRTGMLMHAIAGNPSPSRAESYGEPMEIGALRGKDRGRQRTNCEKQTRLTGRMTPKMADRSQNLTRTNKAQMCLPGEHSNHQTVKLVPKSNTGTPGRQNTPGTGPCYNWALGKEMAYAQRTRQKNYGENNRSVKWARMLSRLQTLQGSGFRTRVLAMNQAKRPQFLVKSGNQN